MKNLKKQEIQSYRKEKYQLDEISGRCLLQPDIRRDLDNSVNILSEQLYSKDLHFIFELIQNAEDNDYPENVSPCLHFELLEFDPTNTDGCNGCLAIYNNEIGFSIENIKAISSVGNSTKSKNKSSGYIGEKGIGFKSVFAVSPSPHIFSNGYKFHFKDKDEITELGYIIPYWFDNVNIELLPKLDEYSTCILLPLRNNRDIDTYQKISNELKSLDPSVLLFLNKLTSISVDIDGDTTQYQKSRLEEKTYLKVISTTGIMERCYFVKKRTIDIPESLKEEKREGVKKRDITLAFPLDFFEQKHLLYAYLPTELTTGLPFLVNADFILSASRESILIDNLWNKWIRDEISLFTFDVLSNLLLTTESYDSFKWIPVVEQCSSEFLLPIFEHVTNKLKNLAFLPCIVDIKRKPVDGVFLHEFKDLSHTLSKVVMQDVGIENYFSSPAISNYTAQLKPLMGLNENDHIVRILVEYLKSSKSRLKDIGADWFLELFSCLSNIDIDNYTDDEHSMLMSAPILLTNNGVVSRNECEVFESLTIPSYERGVARLLRYDRHP